MRRTSALNRTTQSTLSVSSTIELVEEEASDPDLAKVWVIIPAYNESEAINEVLAPLENSGYNIVLVDDGSLLPLHLVVRSARLHICRHLTNLGQGAALQTGIDYALSCGGKYFITFDADGQHNPGEISKLLQPLLLNEADVVLGSRFLEGGGVWNIPFSKRIVLKLAVLFSRATTGLALTDTHNGFRALNLTAAKQIRISQNRMAHASQILQEIAANKLRYREAPVTIRYTDYSMRKGQKISNAFNILWDSLMEVLTR